MFYMVGAIDEVVSSFHLMNLSITFKSWPATLV